MVPSGASSPAANLRGGVANTLGLPAGFPGLASLPPMNFPNIGQLAGAQPMPNLQQIPGMAGIAVPRIPGITQMPGMTNVAGVTGMTPMPGLAGMSLPGLTGGLQIPSAGSSPSLPGMPNFSVGLPNSGLPQRGNGPSAVQAFPQTGPRPSLPSPLGAGLGGNIGAILGALPGACPGSGQGACPSTAPEPKSVNGAACTAPQSKASVIGNLLGEITAGESLPIQ